MEYNRILFSDLVNITNLIGKLNLYDLGGYILTEHNDPYACTVMREGIKGQL